MWVRKLIIVGSSQAVVLPPEVLSALGWEHGDYVMIRLLSANEVSLVKFNPSSMPDRLRESLDPLPVI